MRAELTNHDLPKYFGYLEDILNANNSHWFVGDKMSIADIAVWSLLGWFASGVLDDIPPEILNPFERLKKLYQEVSNNPRVREWKIKTYAHEKTSSDEYAFDVPDSI
jgi:glutathione S-transferase